MRYLCFGKFCGVGAVQEPWQHLSQMQVAYGIFRC